MLRTGSRTLVRVGPCAQRTIHASASVEAKPRRQHNRNNPFALNQMGHFQYDDIPTYGHMRLQKQRQLLEYYRLVKHELPQLKELYEPFTPAPASHILEFQFTHYQGEPHPGARKVVLRVSVADLFTAGHLKTAQAKHKMLLLAGARWQPTDLEAVVRVNAALAESPAALGEAYEKEPLGTIKIASDQFPHEAQNTKWCSDVLDKMIAEAQTEPAFLDVPLDIRPYIKAPARGGRTHKASLADYPSAWR